VLVVSLQAAGAIQLGRERLAAAGLEPVWSIYWADLKMLFLKAFWTIDPRPFRLVDDPDRRCTLV
jgi:hypothetical protein